MNWFKKWFSKPVVKYDYDAIDMVLKIKGLEEQIAKLEKELCHWKTIALNYKKPHFQLMWQGASYSLTREDLGLSG